jgi:hypothetical protein
LPIEASAQPGRPGDLARLLGLFGKRQDAPAGIDLDDAEGLGCLDGNRDAGDGAVGAVFQVEVEHLLDIHLVDMVPAEHDHVVGIFVGDDVERLEDGVGRALKPLAPSSLLRRHRLDVLIEHRRQSPASGNVAVERVAHVLRQDFDLVKPRVHKVRQHKVDQPIATADRHRRLGTIRRQRPQPTTFTTSQNQR